MAGAPPLFDRALGAARATRKRGAEANILTRTIAEELVELEGEKRGKVCALIVNQACLPARSSLRIDQVLATKTKKA